MTCLLAATRFARLTQANNPESGTINYTYDGNGNVTSKADARGITCYGKLSGTQCDGTGYDELNRVLFKTYSDTSTVRAVYAYDGYSSPFGASTQGPPAVGHLTGSWSVNHDGTVVAAEELYDFDAMGRPQLGRQCTPATCGLTNYPLAMAYNYMGNETSLADSSVTRSTGYDSTDRLLSFAATLPGLGNQNLLANPVYNSVGLIQASLGNGLTETRAYNSRTWLQSLGVGSVYSLGLTYAGNGNVLTASDNVNGNWTYGYDGVNRLQTASGNGQSFSYNINPNPWGNMTCSNTGTLPCTPLGFSFNSANNQISTSGYTYDAAGNLLTDNTHHYVYDLENRLTCVLGTDGTCTSASAMNYFYDAAGQRVGKQQADTLEDYVYDPEGHVISIHDGSTALQRAELYTGGRHVATFNPSANYGPLFWNHADWLGTERVRTDSSGTARESCTDTPYGMNLSCTSSDVSAMHFTGLEYDSETGMSHALNRQLAMNIGRWITADPAGKGAVHLDYPQSWNLYAYVSNNPLTLTDPSGLGDEKPPKNPVNSNCGADPSCGELNMLAAQSQTQTKTTVTVTPLIGTVVGVKVKTVTTTVTTDAEGKETKTSTTTITNAMYDLSHADAPRFIPASGNQSILGTNFFPANRLSENEVAAAAGGYSRLYDALGDTVRFDGWMRFFAKLVSGTAYSFSVGPELAAGALAAPAVHTALEFGVVDPSIDHNQLGDK